jgi:hypothetical protein
VRHDVTDQQEVPAKADLCNKPVLVTSDVEYDERYDKVGGIERLLHFRKTGPTRMSGHGVPVFQSGAGIGMLFTKDPNCLVADNMHEDRLDGPIMGSSSQSSVMGLIMPTGPWSFFQDPA